VTVETPAALLRRHGLRPKKEWGQNFLGDERILHALADLAGLRPGDTVIELGAGLGHFTRALAATGARVIAVERDRELAPILRADLEPLGVRVEEADAKSFDLKQIAREAGGPVVLCGNLPYHLSSPILFHALDERRSLRRAVFLLQREVAERVAAPPGGRDYGVLSVLLGLYADARVGMQVPRGAFTPPPEVESSALVLDFLPAPRAEVRDDQRFRALVKAAFAQRRKTLWNALKALPGGRDALERAHIDPQRRGETLSVQEFAAVERALL
jgi:16S rRNA (adenine1518-N6/adenine1519-N6)-dimethyltransferase